eukprot:scaffold13207_cov143-Cylindrotheca_fusiformis.AAC.5
MMESLLLAFGGVNDKIHIRIEVAQQQQVEKMDHDTTTRRRHPTITTTRQTTEVESGGPISLSSRRNQQQRTRKRRRRRKDDDDDDDDLSFSQLVFYVGTTLFVLSFISFWIYRKLSWPSLSTTTMTKSSPLEYDDDDDNVVVVTLQDSTPTTDSKSNSISETLKHLFQQEEEKEEIMVPEPETPPPLPIFNLSKASVWDVYGILDQDNWMLDNTTTTTTNEIFWHAAKGLRQRFADLYGGENAARMLLDQGLTTFFSSSSAGEGEGGAAASSSSSSFVVPYDIIHTACRFQQAEREHRPIRLAFAGYSVTAGRGNMFSQSFPFQLQRILNTVVQLAGITDGLQIRNAAIGGIPSFPYGFCFRNFLGNQPDVISWDYSMNEAGDVPEGLEAYIRHMITTYYPSVPKLIIKDTHMATLRQHVVREYSSNSNSKNWLHDAVILHTDPATKPFLDREEAYRPIGFQNWRTFGAPYGAPGQAHHHPALKEHELLGWILAMHFLTALEYKMIRGTNNLNCPDDPSSSNNKTTTTKQREFLPPPVSKRLMMMMMTNQTNTTAAVDDNNNADYDPILFGHEIQKDQWEINPVQCRTTFQPILQGDLSDLIVSGSIAEDLDVLLPKSQMYYNDGWVLDMSEGEKAVKRKLSLYENSLGFIDSKEAYYGIFESPKLKLFLPYSSSNSSSNSSSSNSSNATAFLPKIGDAANDWYESIVLCQVNEKRIEQACNFGNDVSVTIGTKNISLSEYMMNDAGTLYLGKQVCSHIPIPDGATLTSHNELVNIDSDKLDIDQVGLVLQVFVSNAHIVHIHQACSVSHVVWEEKRRP